MKLVCLNCIEEPFLKAEIAKKETGICDYCKLSHPVIKLNEIASMVETIFKRDYTKTKQHLNPYTGKRERGGKEVKNLVEELVKPKNDALGDLLELLSDKNFDKETDRNDEECEFAEGSMYEEKWRMDFEWGDKWQELKKTLKEEARFFNKKASTILTEIFHDIDNIRTTDKESVITYLPVNSEFFRARAFEDKEELHHALCYPEKEIGAPPPHIAPEGRMSARGISVFYGATEADTAINEIRPPVGSHVIVAKFKTEKVLKVLALKKMQNVKTQTSPFAPSYRKDKAKADFISTLHQQISRAITPRHTTFEYLATQAVADYLAAEGFAGILFPSAQFKGKENIVLFNAFSKCNNIERRGKSFSQLNISQQEDEEDDHYYSIGYNMEESFGAEYDHEVKDEITNDKTATLSIDVHSTIVHYIKAATIDTAPMLTSYRDFTAYRKTVKRSFDSIKESRAAKKE